jgi:group II intron reverse transcriptase/maturase
MSLPTSRKSVETLRNSLQAKAKSEPGYRFYSLWDKVCREDVLREAFRRCRAKGGVAGVDGIGFDAIEVLGVDQWLGTLREELWSRAYAPQPLLRVWIPKRNGGQRPLGIPTVKDRVVQSAVVLVLGAIFEADLLPQQYGFRPKADAKMAVRRAYFHITQHNRREVVDADLSDYFTTIPHGPLMRCLSRRIADGQVLSVIKRWLTAPVCERIGRELVRTTEARDRKRGTPQGGDLSEILCSGAV